MIDCVPRRRKAKGTENDIHWCVRARCKRYMIINTSCSCRTIGIVVQNWQFVSI